MSEFSNESIVINLEIPNKNICEIKKSSWKGKPITNKPFSCSTEPRLFMFSVLFRVRSVKCEVWLHFGIFSDWIKQVKRNYCVLSFSFTICHILSGKCISKFLTIEIMFKEKTVSTLVGGADFTLILLTVTEGLAQFYIMLQCFLILFLCFCLSLSTTV